MAKNNEPGYAFGTIMDTIALLQRHDGQGLSYEEYARESANTLRIRQRGDASAAGAGEKVRSFAPVSRSTFMLRMKTIGRYIPLKKIRDGKTIRYDFKESVRGPGGDHITRNLEKIGINAAEYQALRLAWQRLDMDSLKLVSEQLRSLQTKLTFLLPDELQLRLDPDIDVMARVNAIVARPGPREVVEPASLETISEAILANRILSFKYATRSEPGVLKPWRAEPAAILYGPLRHYLLAFPADQPPEKREKDKHPKSFALANITNLEMTGEPFESREFSLARHVEGAFGAYFGGPALEVRLEFASTRQKDVLTWFFHATEQKQVTPSGSVIVTFEACGDQEIINHLFTWGADVTVLAPESLKERYRERLRLAQLSVDPRVQTVPRQEITTGTKGRPTDRGHA